MVGIITRMFVTVKGFSNVPQCTEGTQRFSQGFLKDSSRNHEGIEGVDLWGIWWEGCSRGLWKVILEVYSCRAVYFLLFFFQKLSFLRKLQLQKRDRHTGMGGYVEINAFDTLRNP